jgi:hypothetical protein
MKETTAPNLKQKWKLREEHTIFEDKIKIGEILCNFFKNKIT